MFQNNSGFISPQRRRGAKEAQRPSLVILKAIHFPKQFWFYFTAETQGRKGGAEKCIFCYSEVDRFSKTILVFLCAFVPPRFNARCFAMRHQIVFCLCAFFAPLRLRGERAEFRISFYL